MLAGRIPYMVVLVDAGALLFEVAPIPLQRFTRRTRVTVSLGIPSKVSPAKQPVFPFVFLPHGRMGFDMGENPQV